MAATRVDARECATTITGTMPRKPPPRNKAEPRYATRPTPRSRGWHAAIESIARDHLKTPLMKWQTDAARLVGEIRADGLPRYSTVIVSVPRQQGKTALSRAAVTARAELLEAGGEIFGTAQTRQYGAKHVIKLGDALTLAGYDVKVGRGVGNEHVTFPHGVRYSPLSPTEKGGHGDSIDFMLVDEGWTLTAEVMGGVRPAMIARPHSQLLVISTMGTVESTLWNTLVTRGRESIGDPDTSTAYIEYSAPTDEAVFDEAQWESWMPALGITVSRESIRAAMADMEPAEIIRAFGNRTTRALVSLFAADWLESAWSVVTPPPQMVLGVDVNDDPAGASVTSAHTATDGRLAGRLIEWRHGSPAWVPDLVRRIITDRQVDAVVGDFRGPARMIMPDLKAICEATYTPFVDRTPSDVAADTGRFNDGLRDGRIVLEKSEPLELALTGARRRSIGDQWLISRGLMTVDASPAIAAVLALGTAYEIAAKPAVGFAIW